jgi:alanyl-tRNA synthetase
MFGEKYGDTVRVVSLGGVSKELCGGTHVDNVTEIGLVRLLSEQAVASGVRRLEFVAGFEAYRQFRQQDNLVKQTCTTLKALPHELVPRLLKLQEELKQAEKTIVQLNARVAMAAKASLIEAFQQSGQLSEGGLPWLTHTLPHTDADALKALGEAIMNESQVEGVLLLASVVDEKASILCWVHEAVVKAHGIKAGDIVKQVATLCGGGGGGKPTFAQAGAKDATKLPEAMAQVSAQTLSHMVAGS